MTSPTPVLGISAEEAGVPSSPRFWPSSGRTWAGGQRPPGGACPVSSRSAELEQEGLLAAGFPCPDKKFQCRPYIRRFFLAGFSGECEAWGFDFSRNNVHHRVIDSLKQSGLFAFGVTESSAERFLPAAG